MVCPSGEMSTSANQVEMQSMSLGRQITASGQQITALGRQNTASGQQITALGRQISAAYCVVL